MLAGRSVEQMHDVEPWLQLDLLARPERADFPLESPQAFDSTGFEFQPELDPMRFEPLRFAKGRVKSLLHRLG